MFHLFNKKYYLKSPVDGELIDITAVPDDVFSTKMMGDGFAVKPTNDQIYSPCDGQVVTVFKTKHAVTLVADNGLELILHIGLDTVKLKGNGFTTHVEDGQTVKAGDLLVTADLDYIANQGFDPITLVVIVNMDKVKQLEPVTGQVAAKADACHVKL